MTKFSNRKAYPDTWLEQLSAAITEELNRREREGMNERDLSLLEDSLRAEAESFVLRQT